VIQTEKINVTSNGVSIDIIDSDKLIYAIESANNTEYVLAQKNILKKLYSHLDASAGKRSAEEISLLLTSGTERDKTLQLYVEEYSKLKNDSFNSIDKEMEEIRSVFFE
jgi:hypothetical protein